MLQEIIGDHPVESNNHKFLAIFPSGTSSIIDTMRLMPLFLIIAGTSIRIPLKNFVVDTVAFVIGLMPENEVIRSEKHPTIYSTWPT